MNEKVRKAFTDAWTLYKKYEDMPDEEEYWVKLTQEGQKLVKENNYESFARAQIDSVISEITRKIEAERKKRGKS